MYMILIQLTSTQKILLIELIQSIFTLTLPDLSQDIYCRIILFWLFPSDDDHLIQWLNNLIQDNFSIGVLVFELSWNNSARYGLRPLLAPL